MQTTRVCLGRGVSTLLQEASGMFFSLPGNVLGITTVSSRMPTKRRHARWYLSAALTWVRNVNYCVLCLPCNTSRSCFTSDVNGRNHKYTSWGGEGGIAPSIIQLKQSDMNKDIILESLSLLYLW